MTSDSGRGPEAQLREYLDELTEDPPVPAAALVTAVVGAARWQYTARPYVLYFGRLLGAIGTALSLHAQRGKER